MQMQMFSIRDKIGCVFGHQQLGVFMHEKESILRHLNLEMVSNSHAFVKLKFFKSLVNIRERSTTNGE
jgi:hypothetical protein